MNNKPVLGASDVAKILTAAEHFAKTNNWAVSISVTDDGGHLLGMVRMDGAAPMTVRMSEAKARTAALGRRETKVFEDIVMQGRVSFLSAPDLEALLEGGVPVVADGQVAGAVGVSGVKSSDDAQIANAGIAALGL